MSHITTSSASFDLIPEGCSHESSTPGGDPYLTVSWSDPDNDRGDVTAFLEVEEAEIVNGQVEVSAGGQM